MSALTAFMRYQIIDRRLRTHDTNHWYHLVDACIMEFYEKSGEKTTISKRTIGYDIQRMRSGDLGYYAPIEFSKEKGYYYSNTDFSIYKPLFSKDIRQKLADTLIILKHLTLREGLADLHSNLCIIEDKLHIQSNKSAKPLIYLEHSLNEAGQKWLDVFYNHIRHRECLQVRYQPFGMDECVKFFSPAFIKEYNNRWYVFGYDHTSNGIINLALDRVKNTLKSLRSYYIPEGFSHDDHFKNLYGVTTPEGQSPVEFCFVTTLALSHYMDTKPIHDSQVKVSSDANSATYTLLVYDNYEIRSKLRSFGEDLVIIDNCSDAG